MDRKIEEFILQQLRAHNAMVLATLRPDGWPQATTLAYANDGLMLYFAADANSQKLRNIAHDERVSVAIARDYADWNKIQGLSMAARAEVLTAAADIEHGLRCLAHRFPDYAELLQPGQPDLAVVRVRPKIISVLDYTVAFGYTQLVEV